jgi:hypothetical protein
MPATAAAVVALSLAVVPATRAEAGPSLAVNAAADKHAISPNIYGLNFADKGLAAQLDLPVDRWGGNSTDTYNWKIGAYNTGNDYFYENIPDCFDAPTYDCSDGPRFGYRKFIAKDRAVGAKTLLTLPMMGYVAKDGQHDHPFTCGFPATVFPNQDSFDPYDTNCGNGLHNGNELASDPTRDGKPIDASFNGDWIQTLKGLYGSASQGGVAYYELGNEPALWSDTHRDMHPDPETYDELWQRSRDLALAVKAADPGAKTFGFSEWGWPNYFCSAADDVENGCFPNSPDRAYHGGTPLVEWFLAQMHAYQQDHGTRLLDYLDLHYYSQGSVSGHETDVTRSLWDPSYTDPSWIGQVIKLIPRMRQWVADDYPGTKVSLSEYNLSESGDPVVNALIEADTLGIFARQRLDLATFWPLGVAEGKVYDAFRIYRNYDGNGAKFGDRWIRSTSADQGKLAVYGARRSSDGKYTILVLNKTAGSLTSSLTLSGFNPGSTAKVWRWTGNGIARIADQQVGGGGFSATYPARSMTLFVVPAT